jgi:hypothetical protein
MVLSHDCISLLNQEGRSMEMEESPNNEVAEDENDGGTSVLRWQHGILL